MVKIVKANLTNSFILLMSFLVMSYSTLDDNNQNIYTTKSGYFAAIDEESFDKMMDFIVDDDKEALQLLINRGKIFELKAGIKVYLVKSSWGKVIIRPKGYDIRVWTVSEAIR